MADQEITNKIANKVAQRQISSASGNAAQAAEAEKQVVEKQKGRSLIQGLTFGFGDEIEAAIRASVPEFISGDERTYEQIRDGVREKLQAYQEAYPAEAITTEIIGAIVPTVAASITGIGGPAAGAATAARTAGIRANMMRALPVSAGQAGVASVGYSDAELGTPEFGFDAGVGTGIGTLVGTGISGMAGPSGRAVQSLSNYVREKFGNKADTAVQAELQRLVEGSGKSIDEIIEDIAAGRVMADNQTLNLAIKSMVKEGGNLRSSILQKSGDRAKKLRQQTDDDLAAALAPTVDDPNIIRARQQSEKAVKKEQSDEYNRIFSGGEELNQQGVEELMTIIQRIPAVRKNLNEVYQARNLVPLFKETDNGAIEFARRPTLEDAESVRRALKEQVDDAFSPMSKNRGMFGEVADEYESSLRDQIDLSSSDLAATRQNYSKMLSANKAFKEGKLRALTMNVDELEVYLEGLEGEVLDAFRAGAMASIRNRARRNKTTIPNLAQEDIQVGSALRVIMPETAAGRKAIDTVETAGPAIMQDKNIQTTANSNTMGLLAETRNRGSRGSLEDALMASQGNPLAMIRMGAQAIKGAFDDSISEKQLMEVVEVLYSEDPNLVLNALTDNTAMAELVNRAAGIVQGTLRTISRPTSQQTSQAVTGN
tara:strand:+ start:1001 stop:2968 length:1968 start_codon:yes stop_codon:yes gene_type:complete